jgi:hypothetical protein
MNDPFSQRRAAERAADAKKAAKAIQDQKDADNYANRTKTIPSQPEIKPRRLGSYYEA